MESIVDGFKRKVFIFITFNECCRGELIYNDLTKLARVEENERNLNHEPYVRLGQQMEIKLLRRALQSSSHRSQHW